MSTLREPVGPKDRRVYVRRRLAVLAGLIAIVVVVFFLIFKPGGQSNDPVEGKGVEVPKDLADSDKASGSDDKQSDEDPACATGQLSVTAITDKADYAEGEMPQLSLSVENTGEGTCVAQLGTADLLFEVSSGNDQVWRSTDCQTDADSKAVLLDPGKPVETKPLEWDRTRSSTDTCDVSREPVAAGGASYHLRVTAAGVKGTGTAQFLLL